MVGPVNDAHGADGDGGAASGSRLCAVARRCGVGDPPKVPCIAIARRNGADPTTHQPPALGPRFSEPSVVSAESEAAAAAERAASARVPLPKAGPSGGESAGRGFSKSVRDAAKAENKGGSDEYTCVSCRISTDKPQIDHAIPRAHGGNATLDNAQVACGFCNASKGARDWPVNAPPAYGGEFPPPWRYQGGN